MITEYDQYVKKKFYVVLLQKSIMRGYNEAVMSGHSKWSTIKRQKGANDAKRGQAFTKLSNAITIAVRSGGSADPNFNFKLRLAVDAARAANMPKDNIDRAISRASGKTAGDMEEGVYEGFAPGGVSVIVETATDNNQRTVGEVKSTFDKNGGSLGVPGAVSYQFDQKGLITVQKNGMSLDDLFLLAAEAGAEDVEDGEEEVSVYTKPDELNSVREALVAASLTITGAEFTRKPNLLVTIDEVEKAQKILNMLEKLESLGDVQKVYANFDIPEEIMKQLM
jgi:YebC/PmpR family DNA-binding regulatory protein